MAVPQPPAYSHGDIQRGETGDKTPGFDPAMAPMETDAEAGGTPTPSTADDGAVRGAREHTNSTSYAAAMRRPADRTIPATTFRYFYIALAIILLAAVATGIALT